MNDYIKFSGSHQQPNHGVPHATSNSPITVGYNSILKPTLISLMRISVLYVIVDIKFLDKNNNILSQNISHSFLCTTTFHNV